VHPLEVGELAVDELLDLRRPRWIPGRNVRVDVIAQHFRIRPTC
jgi:hypothetical protein